MLHGAARMMNKIASLLVLLVAFGGSAAADVPFWGDKTSKDAGTDPRTLKPGQFIWEANAVSSGPIVLVVSVDEQLAYVYRNGIRVGVASVSTGKPGHGTPTGVFTILQKDKDHRSKKYNDAPMPYSERLTWDGVALHAGGLPGYPSSHGCVHLPSEFARLLFGITEMGMTVVVAKSGTAPRDVDHPIGVAPVDARTGAATEVPRLSADEAYRWEPEKAPSGPISVLFSHADDRVFVFRNGVEIGRARITVDQPEKPLGTHAYTALAGDGVGRWVAVSVPGHGGEAGKPLDPAAAARVHMPPAFHTLVRPLLGPGTSLVVTDLPVLEQTTGQSITVVTADPPSEG
jgi:L,D-transpeptidase catalytic domain